LENEWNCKVVLVFERCPGRSALASQVPLEGWLQVLLVAGLIETQLFKAPKLGREIEPAHVNF